MIDNVRCAEQSSPNNDMNMIEKVEVGLRDYRTCNMITQNMEYKILSQKTRYWNDWEIS